MKSFNVFSNDAGDYKAVKKGWSWPAFFFGSIWALCSGLWLVAFLLLPIEFIFSIVGNGASSSFDRYDSYDETTRLVMLAIFSIPLAIRIVLGAVGNTWRGSKLRRLGFFHVGRVKADGKAHAISLCRVASSESARQHLKPMTGDGAATITQSEIDQIIANANPSVAEDIGRWFGEVVSRFGSAKTLQMTVGDARAQETLNPHSDAKWSVGLGEPRGTKTISQGFPPHWLGWTLVALSFLAVADMPYGYYQLLRLMVTGYAGYIATLYFIRRSSVWAWVFAFVALIYNPVFVITMSKDFHALVNLMAAAAVALEIKVLRGLSSPRF